MLSPNFSSRSSISRIIIYAIVITTILLVAAAGSNAAVFSSQESLIDLFGIKPLQVFVLPSKEHKGHPNRSEPTGSGYTFLVPPPAPAFGYNYDIAGSAGGLDATVDSLGNLYSAYESGGNIYIKKNIGDAELVGPGSGPVISVDSLNNIHVIYANAGLKYKKKTGAVWGTERSVPGGTVFYSIDTDSTGSAHIASDDGGTSGRGHIVYVKDNGGTWSDPILDWWGWYDGGCRCGNYYHLPVIRIDNGDKYHLAYESDNWGGQASWSKRAIGIASNSANGDKGVGGFGWNAGVGLTKNSLTLNGADAYIAYTNGGTQNIALVNASWTVLSSFAGSAGTAFYKSGVVGVSFVSGNVQYIEDAGAGFSDPADLGAGSSPVGLLGSRYVFFQAGSDIKLASSVAFEAPKAITAFDLNGLSPAVIGTVNEGAKTVALTVPFGTNVTALVPTISHTGASVNPSSGAANDFTTPQTYIVTATDASSQAYVVTVTVAANPAKAITAFDLNALIPPVIGVVNENAKTVALTVPSGTNVTALVPTITQTGASINPASGTANDFTNAQTYTVTAADASTQPYVVTVTVAAPICVPAPVGLVSWWPGDGNAADVRGGHYGSLADHANYATGKVGSAFNLPGTFQSYVEIPNSAAMNPAGAFSTDGWFYIDPAAPGNAGEISTFIGKTEGSTGNGIAIYFDDRASTRSLKFVLGAVMEAPNAIPSANWYHIAGTFDPASIPRAKLYVNGTVVADSGGAVWGISPNDFNFRIGAMHWTDTYGIGNDRLNGKADEVEIFDRALSAEEIQRIVAAGTAGKCKPTAVTAPSGMVAWWGGSGDARDNSGTGNNGNLMNGAGFGVGKVGQAFNLDGVDDYVEVPHSPSINFGANQPMSFDVWLKRTGTNTYQPIFTKRPDCFVELHYYFAYYAGDNSLMFGSTGAPANGVSTTADKLPLDTWTHVSVSFDGTNATIYINGEAVATHALTLNPNTAPLAIGGQPTCGSYFGGTIDELTFYNRAITPAEIMGIYNAGLAGKLKSEITPANTLAESGRNYVQRGVSIPGIQLGDATVTLPIVTTGGVTQQIPLDPAKLPPLPMGATPTNLTYDIATSAIWSGTPSVCFNLPALSSVYRNLRILHLENGVWVNRTQVPGANPILCTYGLTSLSPFTIADFGPTAAIVSISGRVMTKGGNGVLNAIVQLTDQQGITRTVRTSAFGYYRFDDVPAGENYVIGVASKRFTFTPRNITVTDELTDLDLIAESP